jgi:hypothetical protein
MPDLTGRIRVAAERPTTVKKPSGPKSDALFDFSGNRDSGWRRSSAHPPGSQSRPRTRTWDFEMICSEDGAGRNWRDERWLCHARLRRFAAVFSALRCLEGSHGRSWSPGDADGPVARPHAGRRRLRSGRADPRLPGPPGAGGPEDDPATAGSAGGSRPTTSSRTPCSACCETWRRSTPTRRGCSSAWPPSRCGASCSTWPGSPPGSAFWQ